MKKRKWDWRDILAPLRAWGLLVLLSAGAFCVLALLCLIVISAKKLRYFFIPAFVAYLATLTAIAAWLMHRREKQQFLANVGPELYYEAYPREKRRAQRREARKQNRMKKRKGTES